MIGGFQNRGDWNDISFRGYSQSQFTYHDQIPHYGWDFHYAGGPYLPHQTSRPPIPAVAPIHRPQPVAYCKICEVKLGNYKNVEAHNNGKKHRRMLELHEQSKRLKTSNGHIPNSQTSAIVQPKTILKSGRNQYLAKNASSKVTISKHKNYLQKDIEVTTEVPLEGSEGKPRDNTGAWGHSFKRKISTDKTGKYLKTNDGARRPMESSKFDVNAVSNSVESPIQMPASAPTPVVGSSFKLSHQHVSASQTPESKDREYNENQNPIVEMNNQSHAPAGFDINAQTTHVNSDSTAIATGPPKGFMVSQGFAPQPQVAYCKICEVRLPGYKNVEMHNIGKRHQRMLEQQKELQGRKASKGHISNSQMNSVVQPRRVQKSGKREHQVKNVSSEASTLKHKNYLPKDIGVTTEVPVQGPEKPKDHTGLQGHGFGYKIIEPASKYLKTNNGGKRSMDSSKHDIRNPTAGKNDQPHAPADSNINNQTEVASSDSAAIAIPSPEGLLTSQVVFTPPEAVRSSFEPQTQHVLQTQVLESKLHHEIQNLAMEANDQLQSMSVELHAPAGSDINAQTDDVRSESAAIAIGPPKGLTESRAFELSLPAASSYEPQFQCVLKTEVSECKVHHKIQNPTMGTNHQPQSILVELDAPAVSDTNALTDDVRSDSAAIGIGSTKGLTKSHAFALSLASSFESQIQQTEVSEYNVHDEIQNSIMETNEQPQSIMVVLDAPAGSDINSQTDDVGSDSAAILIGPASQVSAPRPAGGSSIESQIQHALHTETETQLSKEPAEGSSFEPQIQHALHTETETQLSKAITDCQNQNCTDEKNIQLLGLVLLESNAPSAYSSNTQTADGSSKAEQLINQSGKTQLLQVAVCLLCGDKGFPETLVVCNKCQVYALHRYCLDGPGPVIFTDEVMWFCEDCEPKVVDTSSHDQCALIPSGKSDCLNTGRDASQDRIEPKECIKRIKKKKQKQQNIAAKTKVLLSDSHGLGQCSSNCETEKKFGKKCQPVPRDEANTSDGSVIEAVPQPIADPAWRGSLCLRDQSLGTVIEVLAHMSTLACPKAHEETRLFPEVVCGDLPQRSEVWPKSFIECRPNKDSIALFLFPESDSVERAFDKLVDDMISLDLAIRTVIKNAELLVFPSTLLPIDYRRFQEKYYLWGVFRAKSASPNTNYDAVCGEDNCVSTSL
ncbi:uncharacterized protein LOC113867399 [Abrus precatorius]|uniref:Uncharacterized protein LOC113867399 n=1 Tax=Abrus precatorius TaxID=3816 RepID=A0A8B8LQE7_ABRPR|nr:uncharacterized protein LOC113867399 [Abrus precatorius]